MQVIVGNNSFIYNNYGAQSAQGSYLKYRLSDAQNTYSKNHLSTLPLNAPEEQIFETYRNLSNLIDVLENKIYNFQVFGNPHGLQDKYLEDLKNLVSRLRILRVNLSVNNIEQTLADVKSLGSDNYKLLRQLLRMQNLNANKKSTPIRSYMFSLYDRVNEKKTKSLGIDVYY